MVAPAGAETLDPVDVEYSRKLPDPPLSRSSHCTGWVIVGETQVSREPLGKSISVMTLSRVEAASASPMRPVCETLVEGSREMVGRQGSNSSHSVPSSGNQTLSQTPVRVPTPLDVGNTSQVAALSRFTLSCAERCLACAASERTQVSRTLTDTPGVDSERTISDTAGNKSEAVTTSPKPTDCACVTVGAESDSP